MYAPLAADMKNMTTLPQNARPDGPADEAASWCGVPGRDAPPAGDSDPGPAAPALLLRLGRHFHTMTPSSNAIRPFFSASVSSCSWRISNDCATSLCAPGCRPHAGVQVCMSCTGSTRIRKYGCRTCRRTPWRTSVNTKPCTGILQGILCR